MKTKNLFLLTMVLLFGVVIKSSGQTTWSTTGNNGTNPSTNFIGTMDDVPLVFKIHSTQFGVANPFAGELHKFFTSFGFNSGHSGYSVYIGSQAGQNTIPFTTALPGGIQLFNTYVGHQAGVGSNSNTPAPGNYNTFLGNNSGSRNFDGHHNLFSGALSGYRNTSGFNNVFLGTFSGAGNFVTQEDVTGEFNTFVGYSSGPFITSGKNNTFIGHDCGGPISTGSGNTLIGNVSPSNIALNNTIILADGSNNQRFYIHSNGYAGIGLGNNIIPQNTLEVKALPLSPTQTGGFPASGLRLSNLSNTNFNTVAPTSNRRVLTVNATGDVILVDDQVGNGGGTPGISNDCSSKDFIPKTIDANGNLKCSQIYDNWNGECKDINPSGVSIGYCPNVNNNIFQYNAWNGTIINSTVNTNPNPSQAPNVTPTGNLKLRVKGPVLGNVFFSTSDANYKTNVSSLEKPLDKVLQLKGVSYNWDITNNPDMNFDEGDHTGFIAQQVEEIIPHVVITQNMGDDEEEKLRKSVNYIELIPYLVESIKALNEKINGLEAQIQCLNESTGCNRSTTNKSDTKSLLENNKIISVSPNPSNDVISVSLNIEKSVQTATLNVYDLNGKLMSSLNINDRSTNITKTLQKDNFGTGVYIVSLVVNGKSIDSKKIVFK